MSTDYHISDFGLTETVKETYTKYQSTIITAIMTAFLLLVSLAWNDVIQTSIQQYYPHKDINTIKGKVSYAVVITIFVVLLQIYVFPYIERYK
jgi:TRAP-type C4-dicarboxylate transport system permease small subunit